MYQRSRNPIHGRVVAFHSCYARIAGGSANVGLFLSQCVYWADVTNDPEGWFHKTREEWTSEICLSRREQETVRERLRELGVLEEKLEGFPSRTYYRVNFPILDRLIEDLPINEVESNRVSWAVSDQVQNDPQGGTKTPGQVGGNVPPAHGTESTTKSTTKSTCLPVNGKTKQKDAFTSHRQNRDRLLGLEASGYVPPANRKSRGRPSDTRASDLPPTAIEKWKCFRKEFQEKLGYPIPLPDKQQESVLRMLETYESKDVIGCYKKMTGEEWWKNKNLYMEHVEMRIGEYIREWKEYDDRYKAHRKAPPPDLEAMKRKAREELMKED